MGVLGSYKNVVEFYEKIVRVKKSDTFPMVLVGSQGKKSRCYKGDFCSGFEEKNSDTETRKRFG